MFSVRLRITSCIEYKGRGQSGAEKCLFPCRKCLLLFSTRLFNFATLDIDSKERERERKRREIKRKKNVTWMSVSSAATATRRGKREREREEEEEEERDGLKADTRVGARARY